MFRGVYCDRGPRAWAPVECARLCVSQQQQGPAFSVQVTAARYSFPRPRRLTACVAGCVGHASVHSGPRCVSFTVRIELSPPQRLLSDPRAWVPERRPCGGSLSTSGRPLWRPATGLMKPPLTPPRSMAGSRVRCSLKSRHGYRQSEMGPQSSTSQVRHCWVAGSARARPAAANAEPCAWRVCGVGPLATVARSF